jgi:hypothetical protein
LVLKAAWLASANVPRQAAVYCLRQIDADELVACQNQELSPATKAGANFQDTLSRKEAMQARKN